MKKQYKPLEENPEDNMVREPEAIPYDIETELTFSPPLTEEEWAESMSTEEFKEYWFKCIDEICKK